MFQLNKTQDEICTRFEQIPWHDSKLVGVIIVKEGMVGYHVTLQVSLLSGLREGQPTFTSASLKFSEARIFQSDFDLLGLKYCGGAVASGTCRTHSDFMVRIESDLVENPSLRPEVNPFAQMKHFLIHLIPPGGDINIIARDFELTVSEP